MRSFLIDECERDKSVWDIIIIIIESKFLLSKGSWAARLNIKYIFNSICHYQNSSKDFKLHKLWFKTNLFSIWILHKSVFKLKFMFSLHWWEAIQSTKLSVLSLYRIQSPSANPEFGIVLIKINT